MKIRLLSLLAGVAIIGSFPGHHMMAQSYSDSKSTSSAQPGFTVHEWGTFTSVQGGDGELLSWRPLKTSELPGFVYNWGRAGLNRYSSMMFFGKGEVNTLQRMETPVIYFYSDKEMSADVSLGFPKGQITEWYPQATQIGPSNPIDTNSPAEFALPESRATWKNLLLTPSSQRLSHRAGLVSEDKPGNHYYAARKTVSDMVQLLPLTPTNAIETEKFIFYRGTGNFKTPLRVTTDANGRILVQNTGGDALSHLIYVSIHYGRGSYLILDKLTASNGVTRISLDPHAGWKNFPLAQFQDAIGAEMESALTREGLFPLEARAMVETWRDSWFTEEGDRVFYVLPRTWTDETLPLSVTPQAENIVRVMVGRAEIITPNTQRALADSLAKAVNGDISARNEAIAQLRKVGRFGEPAVRLANVHGGPDSMLYGYELLPEANKPAATQLEQLYLAWHAESETIAASSVTGDFIGLPAFRKMVAVGKPALPFLRDKMKNGYGLDFMLAFAAVEISGWDQKDFRGREHGEQAFRDRVLEKLQETKN